MNLTQREVKTILYSLRATQALLFNGADIHNSKHFSRAIKPLTIDEIGNLCERLYLYGNELGLYHVSVLDMRSVQVFLRTVVRASNYMDASQVALRVIHEKCHGNKSIPVDIVVDNLIEPNHGVAGECYQRRMAPKIFHEVIKAK